METNNSKSQEQLNWSAKDWAILIICKKIIELCPEDNSTIQKEILDGINESTQKNWIEGMLISNGMTLNIIYLYIREIMQLIGSDDI